MSSFFFTGAGSLLKRLSSSRSELADLFEAVFSVEPLQGSEEVVEVAGAEVGGAEKSSNRDSNLSICFMPCIKEKEH